MRSRSPEEILMIQEAGHDERDARVISKVKPGDRVPGVYFVSAAGANLIKIGFVANVQNLGARLDVLQAGCPYALVPVFVAVGATRRDEWRVHKLFDEHRFRAEWFRCEGHLKAFLQYAAALPDDATIKLRYQLLD